MPSKNPLDFSRDDDINVPLDFTVYLPETAEDIPSAEEKRAMIDLWNRFCVMTDLLLTGVPLVEEP